MQIRNGDIDLHVARDGDPLLPPILLLHGITSFGGTWDWIVPTLVERFHVLRLDFRGHGRSDRAPGEYGSAGYVSDAVAALEQAAGQPCVVMGHSLGGADGSPSSATWRRTLPLVTCMRTDITRPRRACVHPEAAGRRPHCR